MEDTSFSWALTQLKSGQKVARQGWNGIMSGKSMYLQLQIPDQNSKMNNMYIYMTSYFGTEPHSLVPWVASQLDLLATDWLLI